MGTALCTVAQTASLCVSWKTAAEVWVYIWPQICLLNLNPIKSLIKTFYINCYGNRKMHDRGKFSKSRASQNYTYISNLLQLIQNAQKTGTLGRKSRIWKASFLCTILSLSLHPIHSKELFYFSVCGRRYRMAWKDTCLHLLLIWEHTRPTTKDYRRGSWVSFWETTGNKLTHSSLYFGCERNILKIYKGATKNQENRLSPNHLFWNTAPNSWKIWLLEPNQNMSKTSFSPTFSSSAH